jgi:hypothetical protein
MSPEPSMETASQLPPPPSGGRPASALLDELADGFPDAKISIGELLDKLDARATGVLLLVLALPMCIPNVPGISTIFGILMLAPAAQLVFGMRRLWVPRRVRAMQIDAHTLRRTFTVVMPTLRRLEYLIKPRWSALTRFPFTIYVGLQTLFMAFVLILPIPLGNWPPGMTVALTALALLQRDGLLMLITAGVAAVSTYIAASVGIIVLHQAVQWFQAVFQ